MLKQMIFALFIVTNALALGITNAHAAGNARFMASGQWAAGVHGIARTLRINLGVVALGLGPMQIHLDQRGINPEAFSEEKFSLITTDEKLELIQKFMDARQAAMEDLTDEHVGLMIAQSVIESLDSDGNPREASLLRLRDEAEAAYSLYDSAAAKKAAVALVLSVMELRKGRIKGAFEAIRSGIDGGARALIVDPQITAVDARDAAAKPNPAPLSPAPAPAEIAFETMNFEAIFPGSARSPLDIRSRAKQKNSNTYVPVNINGDLDRKQFWITAGRGRRKLIKRHELDALVKNLKESTAHTSTSNMRLALDQLQTALDSWEPIDWSRLQNIEIRGSGYMGGTHIVLGELDGKEIKIEFEQAFAEAPRIKVWLINSSHNRQRHLGGDELLALKSLLAKTPQTVSRWVVETVIDSLAIGE